MRLLALILSIILLSQSSALAFSCNLKKDPEVTESKTDTGTTFKIEPAKDLERCNAEKGACEETLGECDAKVKELSNHIDKLNQQLDDNIKLLDQTNKYTDKLEKELKENDPNSFWNRNKMLIGFVGGILLTTGIGIGVGVMVK